MDYEAQVRAGYCANPVAQRAVRLVMETLAGAPLQGDEALIALATARPSGRPVIETLAAQLLLHGNALARIDIAAQAVVQDVGLDAPPSAPSPGACWIVGEAPTGAWVGHAGALAGWTAGGWRFLAPFPGMQAWDLASGTVARRGASGWQRGALSAANLSIGGTQVVGAQRPAIAAAAGGGTVDAEARATLAAVLGALRGHGLIAS